MSITSKIRLARGLRSELPTPPHSFEIGRPFFCKDTGELFVGEGENLPMKQVTGLPFDFLGAWDSVIDYQVSDLVTFGSVLYVAIAENTDKQPDENPDDWASIDVVVATGPQGPKGDKGDPGAASTIPGPQGAKGDTQLISATSFPTTDKALTPVAVSFNTAGDQIVVPGVAGKTIEVWKLLLVCSDSTTLQFKNGTTPQSGPLVGKLSIVLDIGDKAWYSASPGNDLIINSASDVLVGGTLWIAEV